jgi:hypothetical protein
MKNASAFLNIQGKHNPDKLEYLNITPAKLANP